jgi:Flp pilus assembly protein TadG
MTKPRNKRSGQALVESALTMMIFLPVLIGIADFGQFLYLHQTLTDRARSAARWGAVHAYTSAGDHIKEVAVYEMANPPAGTAAILPNLTTGMVTATLDDVGTDSARITVKISDYPYNFLSPYMSKITWYRTIIATEPYEIPN